MRHGRILSTNGKTSMTSIKLPTHDGEVYNEKGGLFVKIWRASKSKKFCFTSPVPTGKL